MNLTYVLCIVTYVHIYYNRRCSYQLRKETAFKSRRVKPYVFIKIHLLYLLVGAN